MPVDPKGWIGRAARMVSVTGSAVSSSSVTTIGSSRVPVPVAERILKPPRSSEKE
ncbi:MULTISPECIES: hypothetical protein [Mesorhizobium]|uniref:hypothetical protein n=1 Tax=Mesorhizobium TaxID=68287 RepID=UPI001FD0C6DC|nr:MULTISPECIES: hypothetical protein [Mesorhizobium]